MYNNLLFILRRYHYGNCDPRSTDVLEYTRYRKISFNQGLVQREGRMIYLDKKGNMVKLQGWKTISDRKYYFKEDGTAVKESKTIIGDKMYVFGKYAECEGAYTGWQSTKNGKRYYNGGKYVTGTQTIDGKKYTFDKNGYLK